jgi:hypothetical protein
MAAKTFTLTANGAATGQQITGGSTCALVSGTLNGGRVILEISPDNVLYVPIPDSLVKSSKSTVSSLVRCSIPKDWYVRPVLSNAYGVISVTVVVDDAD